MSDWEDPPAAAAPTTSDGWEDPAALPAEKPRATAGERTAAAVGGVNKGLAGILGLPVDTIENIINIALSTRGLLTDDPNIQMVKGSFGSSEHVREVMEKAGIGTENPRPDDSASRMLHTGGTIVGGSVVPGAGVKNTVTAATGGAVAGEALGEGWTGVGALAPASASQAARGVKTAVAAKTAENVKTFKEAGAGTPSIGQATENSFAQGLENLASKFPGGSGVMRRFAEGQQKGMHEQVRTGVTAEDAGRAIKAGGARFVDDFKATSTKLYDDLDQHIQKDTPVDVFETRAALQAVNADVPGAPALSKSFQNAKLQDIEKALKADTAAGAQPLPYEAVKKLRTLVGQELATPSLVSDVPRAKWKALYGALSKDMEALAASQGPKAEQSFARANAHYKAGIKRIDETIEPLLAKVEPEEVFKAFSPNNPDQVTKVRAVMRSLKPEERVIVTQAVVNRMGRATPGRQDELGDVFSSETFLTNWNRLSGGAKAQLFPEDAMRKNIEAMAQAAARIREGSKVFQNASGTAGSFAAYSVYASPIAAVATGSLAPLVAAGGAAGSAYIGARMLTSPKIVEWLARAPRVRADEAAQHLTRLAVIYNSADDETKAELDRYMESVKDAPVRAVNTKDENNRKKRRDELLQMIEE